MQSDDFEKRRLEILNELEYDVKTLDKGEREAKRVINIVANSDKVLDDLDEEFCKKTGLTKTDMAFQFVATGLQILRQYLVTSFPERLPDGKAAKKAKDGVTNKLLNKISDEYLDDFDINVKEHSDRKHRYYNPSLEEIITNPVPFDANVGADGFLSGGGELRHRVTAIGHDPILGLIFGTANIATSTITNHMFQSCHVRTGLVACRGGMRNGDIISEKANTMKILDTTYDKLVNQGSDGKVIVICSLLKEIVHLQSDINSTHGLPLPVLSAMRFENLNAKTASKLAKYGIDAGNIVQVGKQAAYASMINMITAIVHRLFAPEMDEKEEKLYEVRTRKILSYSNLIASTSNIVVSVCTQNFSKLDLGGIGVTIYRLITDSKFIREAKEEFIFGNYKDMIMGDGSIL